MNATEEQIVNLYTGYLDRAPDRDGFNYWLNEAANGWTILDIANSFAQSSEYLSIYGGLSGEEFLVEIYDNLFDRLPDVEGKNYWLAQLDSGVSSARLIVDVISGARGNDRLTLQNTAIVAKDWTDHSPGQFVLADAQNAVRSIGEVQGNGVTIDFADSLLPWADQFTAAMQAAWAQWGNHGRLDVKLDYWDMSNNVLAFAYARNEFYTGQTNANGVPITQSNVGVEINTGLDMNGDLPDINITIAMNPANFFNHDTTSVLAHEIGHGLGFRTELFDLDQDYSTITSWDQFLTFPNGTTGPAAFNGPEAMALYGGPVPITGYYNSTHPNGIGSIMDPTFGAGEVRVVGLLDKAMMRDIGVLI